MAPPTRAPIPTPTAPASTKWLYYLVVLLVPVGFLVAAISGALGPALRLDGTMDTVAVVHVEVTVSLEPAASAEGAPAADPIQAPHCAQARLDGNRLLFFGPGYDRQTSVVLLIDYRGEGSFSGGGDDRMVEMLRPGDDNGVRPAMVRTPPLYRVLAQATVSIVPEMATLTEPDHYEATYTVSGAAEPRPWFETAGNTTVTEVHEVVIGYNVAVVQQPAFGCM